MSQSPKVSIIIPTLQRPESLTRCLESIKNGSYKDYEIILVEEEGELAALRNQGARRAKGDYLVFIDDDVRVTYEWLESIVSTLSSYCNVAGCSGPAVITGAFKRNRDLFSFRRIKRLYDLFFLEGREHLPGHFCKSGAWTTGACNETCVYEGPVDFLEACNMAFKKDDFWKADGFDENYKGVGDWSEPDLAFRIRKTGKLLWFSRSAKLYHEPSKSGAFKKRKRDSGNRMANYEIFSARHIKPNWKHGLYKLFMRTYYFVKTIT